jgi:hypothetical protein
VPFAYVKIFHLSNILGSPAQQHYFKLTDPDTISLKDLFHRDVAQKELPWYFCHIDSSHPRYVQRKWICVVELGGRAPGTLLVRPYAGLAVSGFTVLVRNYHIPISFYLTCAFKTHLLDN